MFVQEGIIKLSKQTDKRTPSQRTVGHFLIFSITSAKVYRFFHC